MKIYRHKKNLLYQISNQELNSRYVVAVEPEKINPNHLRIQRHGQEVKVVYTQKARWLALVSDLGFQLQYLNEKDKSQATFTLHNEVPLSILVGVSDLKVLYYAMLSPTL